MAKNSEKDREMAKHLKQNGVVRTTGRCPICNAVVNVKTLVQHITFHT